MEGEDSPDADGDDDGSVLEAAKEALSGGGVAEDAFCSFGESEERAEPDEEGGATEDGEEGRRESTWTMMTVCGGGVVGGRQHTGLGVLLDQSRVRTLHRGGLGRLLLRIKMVRRVIDKSARRAVHRSTAGESAIAQSDGSEE